MLKRDFSALLNQVIIVMITAVSCGHAVSWHESDEYQKIVSPDFASNEDYEFWSELALSISSPVASGQRDEVRCVESIECVAQEGLIDRLSLGAQAEAQVEPTQGCDAPTTNDLRAIINYYIGAMADLQRNNLIDQRCELEQTLLLQYPHFSSVFNQVFRRQEWRFVVREKSRGERGTTLQALFLPRALSPEEFSRHIDKKPLSDLAIASLSAKILKEGFKTDLSGAINWRGKNLLLLAVEQGNDELAFMLMKRGWNFRVNDFFGNNIFHALALSLQPLSALSKRERLDNWGKFLKTTPVRHGVVASRRTTKTDVWMMISKKNRKKKSPIALQTAVASEHNLQRILRNLQA